MVRKDDDDDIDLVFGPQVTCCALHGSMDIGSVREDHYFAM